MDDKELNICLIQPTGWQELGRSSSPRKTTLAPQNPLEAVNPFDRYLSENERIPSLVSAGATFGNEPQWNFDRSKQQRSESHMTSSLFGFSVSSTNGDSLGEPLVDNHPTTPGNPKTPIDNQCLNLSVGNMTAEPHDSGAAFKAVSDNTIWCSSDNFSWDSSNQERELLLLDANSLHDPQSVSDPDDSTLGALGSFAPTPTGGNRSMTSNSVFFHDVQKASWKSPPDLGQEAAPCGPESNLRSGVWPLTETGPFSQQNNGDILCGVTLSPRVQMKPLLKQDRRPSKKRRLSSDVQHTAKTMSGEEQPGMRTAEEAAGMKSAAFPGCSQRNMATDRISDSSASAYWTSRAFASTKIATSASPFNVEDAKDVEHPTQFVCIFGFAGCASVFTRKADWKRHINTQHVVPLYWHCVEGNCAEKDDKSPWIGLPGVHRTKGNYFSRMDLFKAHVRRKSGRVSVTTPSDGNEERHRSYSKRKQKTNQKMVLNLDGDFQAALEKKAMRRRCALPQFMRCPAVSGCGQQFQGPKAWNQWLEHVAKHLISAAAGESLQLVFEGGPEQISPLVEWAATPDVGILRRTDDGRWELTFSHPKEKHPAQHGVRKRSLADAQRQGALDGMVVDSFSGQHDDCRAEDD
ncbi:hypothetical protein VTK73DRAFT_4101 [Phialemonium thermophilum]|uniref:C2H2-type domain-containing protein n=1 Tax=Phialemonium thermophilum TaxID=223376 RepID=A0ABR3WV48_9PEZI